jgi:predicted PurR-regulated permease PerM
MLERWRPEGGSGRVLGLSGEALSITKSVITIVFLTFFIVYQQLENHFLQPVVYERTVKLSPLVVLVSVFIGAELAGIIGAPVAIPVAGAST